MTMTRKQFLRSLAGAGIGAVGASVLIGCGSDNPATPDARVVSCTLNGTAVTIAGNHGHTLVVSTADIAAAADKTYNIMGTSPHTHMVTITAAQFAMLAANTSITVVSTDALHTHSVTVACA